MYNFKKNSRLFPGVEICWANFKPFSRIQDLTCECCPHGGYNFQVAGYGRRLEFEKELNVLNGFSL